MRYLTAMGIGATIGVVAYYVVRKFEKKEVLVEETIITSTKETVSEESEEPIVTEMVSEPVVQDPTVVDKLTIKLDDLVVETEAKNRTLKETILHYTTESNAQMLDKVQQIVEYLKDEDIYHDPRIGETTKAKTIDELCQVMNVKNNKLKKTYEQELENTKNTILVKSTRKLSKIVFLPEEIQSRDKSNNIAFTRTLRLSHVEDARNRIDGITKQFTLNSLKILEKDYVQLLFNLVNMHKDLLKLGRVLPTIHNVTPSINVIADDVYSLNKKKYLDYLEDHVSAEEYEFITKYDKSLEFGTRK